MTRVRAQINAVKAASTKLAIRAQFLALKIPTATTTPPNPAAAIKYIPTGRIACGLALNPKERARIAAVVQKTMCVRLSNRMEVAAIRTEMGSLGIEENVQDQDAVRNRRSQNKSEKVS